MELSWSTQINYFALITNQVCYPKVCFRVLVSNEHSFPVTRIDLALCKTSKMCIQGASCQHQEFCSTDSILFKHKSKLGQIHCHLTLVRALICTNYNAFHHCQLDMVVKGSTLPWSPSNHRKMQQKIIPKTSKALFPTASSIPACECQWVKHATIQQLTSKSIS